MYRLASADQTSQELPFSLCSKHKATSEAVLKADHLYAIILEPKESNSFNIKLCFPHET